MTERENELLEIAKNVISLNKGIDAKLSGSLMLKHRGFKTRREAGDIDIICDFLCENKFESGYPDVPGGFKLVDMEGGKSQVEAIQFKNQDGVKIEFMVSDERGEVFDDILCASVSQLIAAKLDYSINDKTEESRHKHLFDLLYIFDYNHSMSVTLK